MAAGQGLSEEQKTIIRYVLNPSNPKITLDAFPWKMREDAFVVYRGQSFTPKMKSSSVEEATSALEIQTNRSRPISTSEVLSDHIVKFAVGYDKDPLTGRLFKITVEPGVRFVDIPAAVKEMNLPPNAFEFLKAELEEQAAAFPVGTPAHDSAIAYSKRTPEFLRANFFVTVTKEQEVLIDPRKTQVVAEGGPEATTYPIYKTRIKLDKGAPVLNNRKEKVRESYKSEETKPIEQYPVRLKLLTGGRRGRTFRRKPKRSNKNGRRFTRKSKHDVRRDRHA